MPITFAVPAKSEEEINRRTDPLERFHQRHTVEENGCWLWTGAVFTVNGYARFHGLPGGTQLAHRWIYERLVGPIPEGFQIDHLCRVRKCVNPDHLEAVTASENQRRGFSPVGVNAHKTHCIHGHPFDSVNSYTYLYKGQPARRRCRACGLDSSRRKRQREKAARRAL